jgi:hypothetical protein
MGIRRIERSLLVAVLLLAFLFPASALRKRDHKYRSLITHEEPAEVNEAGPEVYPYTGMIDLEKRALLIEEDMERGNLSYGLPLARVLLPPDGNADNSTACQEDGANQIGPLMAAYCYRYKVTGSTVALERVLRTAQVLEKMERVTGVDGLIARSINLTDKPQRHEQWFFFPMEWHWSPRYPNTRWLGDPSSDSLTRFLYGNALYYDLVADTTEKARVSALVDRVLKRFVDFDFKIVDEDGKMTLWGNYCPDLPHQPLNALLCLAALKIGSHITGNPRYEEACWHLIREHQYHEETLAADSTVNADTPVHWDRDLGMTALFHLFEYETDPWLLGFYRASLERFREPERERKARSPFYDFVYKACTKDMTPAGPQALAGLLNWNDACREYREDWMEEDQGRVLVKGVWQDSAEDFPRSYWMGRYYGFISQNFGK